MSATVWPILIYPQPTPRLVIWPAQPAPVAPSEVIVQPTAYTENFQAAAPAPNFTTYVDPNVTQKAINTEFKIIDLRLATQDRYGFPIF